MPLSEAREAHLARLFAPDSTFPTDAPDDADGTNAGDAFDDFFRRTRGAALVVDTNVLLDLYYWKDPRSVELREAIEAGRLVPASIASQREGSSPFATARPCGSWPKCSTVPGSGWSSTR